LIMGLADWIYCLDAGQNLATGAPATVSADPAVIEAYLGTRRERERVAAAPSRRKRAKSNGEPPLLELTGVDVFYDKVQVLYDDPKQVSKEMDRCMSYFPWIAERFDQPAGTLSGGEQQQLATARALMTRPELLMIDELSLGLAPLVIERLMETVQRLHEDDGLTVLLVEQQASFALGYTDRAYFLEKGEIRYDGASAGLGDRPDLLRSVFL